MVRVALVASTRPTGRVDPLTSAEAQWCNRTSGWSLPGRFAFFTFRIDCEHLISDLWFPGLQTETDESGLFAGGSLDNWDSACYALLKSSSPHDCCVIYRHVYTTLSDFGYTLRGTKSTNHERFFLL